MKKTFYLLFAPLLIVASASAQEKTDSATVRNYTIEELVVTGTRSETDVRHLSQTVTVVNRHTLEERMQQSLLPVLTEEVAGMFVTQRGVMGYGVSGGAAGGISIRGMSGGTARVMVMIDGHPQYAGIFGHPIADACQTYWAEKVEVLRGPASVLYGSNAMGGVINIVTQKNKEDGVRTHARAGYGSYNTLETEVTNQVRKGRFTSTVSGSYNRTDGHRENMNFEQYGGYAKLGFALTDNWSARADINATHFNASYPGPEDAPLEDGDQSITRGMTSFAVEDNYEKTSGAASFFYNWGRHKINDGYTPSEGEGPKDYRFHSRDRMMGVSVYQSAQCFEGNRVTVGFDWFRYGGHAWNKYVSGENAGTEVDVVDKTEDEVAGYVDFRQNVSYWLTLNAGVRVDHHSRVGTEVVPQGGMAFHLPYFIELKASATKGFRYPILREMYMYGAQNPDLDAEEMWNYEVAFSQRLKGGRLTYGVNLFYIDGENMIETVANPNGSGRLNRNTGEVENMGFEVEGAFGINEHWRVSGNYSFLHMENPVIAAPEHKVNVGGAYSCGRWNVSTGVQYIGGLYTAVGDEEEQEDYVVWNMRGSVRLAKWVDIWVRGENLLAQRYEINAGYPMAKCTVYGGVNIKF